uniref:Uncharacterized protein n=1 Tax=Zea mays TaxID=4577 RepID=A0A804QWW1_MAIZE
MRSADSSASLCLRERRRGRPHSALFPINDLSVIFENTPPSGICPSNLLKERFKLARLRYIIMWSSPKETGMSPDSLFPDKSIMVIAVNFPTSAGRNPLKEFCDKSSSISF